jgi:AraC-like DNA-binding protein/DNA-binding winged helix-turn-helix (wHTH) protein
MIHAFAGYELDTRTGQLRSGQGAVPVEPQVFALLCLLVENRDRLVTKDEIVERIWDGRIVSDATIASRIKSARQAVGDDCVAQRIIRTVHGRGLRFVADVETTSAPATAVAIREAVAVAVAALDAGDPDAAAELCIDYWMGPGAWKQLPEHRKPPIAAAVMSVRRWADALFTEPTPIGAFPRDPSVGRALSLLHSRVGESWTAEALAREVNMSRSTFADRFTALLGQPPMRYLTGWRMQLARHYLAETRRSVAQIAFEVGYESEAAFNRAFHRECGSPPATWRRKATQ